MIVGYFSKKKMLDRVEKEGLSHLLSPDILALLDELNGKEVDNYCWRNYVMDENIGIIRVPSYNRDYTEINLADVCKTIAEWEITERSN